MASPAVEHDESLHLYFYIYVLQSATTYQGKFLVRENVPGNKSDSDSDSEKADEALFKL